MKRLKILLLTIVTLFTMSGCCWTDHSETIKEVANPMLTELDDFYQKNKRFPTIKERDIMLIKSGCKKIKGNKCSYGWKTFSIQNADSKDTFEYYMGLNYDNTYCYLGVYNDGKMAPLSCDNTPCIDWGR